MKHDSLGDRMKFYESIGAAAERLMPLVPVMIRLDGKAFHTFTKGMQKPFDYGLMELMKETTKFLVQETNAKLGYTQSDEITLVILNNESMNSQIYLDGRIAKINSILGARCSVYFNARLAEFLPAKAGLPPERLPIFDCRCWNVPTQTEAANAVLWREQDATRNSVQMAARAVYSHRQCHLKNNSELQDMLHEKGINWNDYPSHAKRGCFIQQQTTFREFEAEEIEKLPPKHAARRDPNLKIKRKDYIQVEMPIFTKIQNREEVIFEGAEPITEV